jgi:hypothetical protein
MMQFDRVREAGGAVHRHYDELHPRKWNHSFIDLPRIRNPKQPSFTREVVMAIVAGARKEKYQLFFALCGGTGLRFGEALGDQKSRHLFRLLHHQNRAKGVAVTDSQFSQDRQWLSRD